MASGSFYTAWRNDAYKLIVNWSSTPNYDDNTSIVDCIVQLYAPYRLNIGGRDKNVLTINGVDYEFETEAIKTDGGTYHTLTTQTSEPIPHNADGTKSITISCKYRFMATLSDVYYGNQVATETVDLGIIAHEATITSASNFTDLTNPYIEYSNRAGAAVDSLEFCLSLDGTNTSIAYRTLSKTGTSGSMILTEAERNTLRAATPNSNSNRITYIVKTVIQGKAYYSKLTKTYTIEDAKPTLTPSITDISTETTNLTGNSNVLVRYYSEVFVSASAAAKKYATIKEVKITCGGETINGSNGVFEGVESGTFTFTVIDSRNNKTTQTITKPIINYVKLTCGIEAQPPTASGNVKLTVKGNYFNGGFGAEDNILVVMYRRKVEGGSYGSWNYLTPAVSNNSYTVSINESGLDYQTQYTYQARAIDRLLTIDSDEVPLKSRPIFDWGANDFNFNVPVSCNDALYVKDSVIFDNATSIFSKASDGTLLNVMWATNYGDETVLGAGSLSSQIGGLKLFGNEITMMTNSSLTVNGYNLLATLQTLSNTYSFDVSAIAGDNYSSFTGSADLVGGQLRIYFNGTRTSATSTGDISNEVVGTLSINHGGRIKNAYQISFCSGNTGGVATFQTNNMTNSNNTLTVDITLCATTTQSDSYSGYFILPASLNLFI